VKREKGRKHDHLSPLGAISLVMVENKQYFPARNLAKSSPKICFLAENEPKQKKEAWASTFIEIYLHNSGFGLCASLSLFHSFSVSFIVVYFNFYYHYLLWGSLCFFFCFLSAGTDPQ